MNKGFSSLVVFFLLALCGCTSGVRASQVEWAERVKARRAEVERVRLAKEEEERKRLEAERNPSARREKLLNKVVEYDLAAIRKCYADGKRYLNPFLGEDRNGDKRVRQHQIRRSGRNHTGDVDRRTDWLSKWSDPRLPLSEAEAMEGRALLAEFAEKFLPNAYANYEKKREALLLLQQVFNEEFSAPWTIKDSHPKWDSFNKVLEKFVRARTAYFICHDELLHYWYMYRFGVLGGEDFAQIDAKPLAVPLYRVRFRRGALFDKVNVFEENARVFAVKHAPESNAVYQKMENEFKQLDALINEVGIAQRKMDSVRYYCTLFTAIEKRNELVRKMNALSKSLTSWYFEHKTMEKTSEDVAKCDREEANKLASFIKALPSYIKENVSDVTCIVPRSDMISIPGQGYKIQRTEVTQAQWEAVMGNNPSKFKGLNRPVENVSWDDCQKFIEKLNKLEGRKYRLPTEKEWEYACRAGSTSKYWGKRKNGQDGPPDVMGWYECRNSNWGTQNVAQKEPNAWWLYDMHGNVAEWCQDLYSSGKSSRVLRGGCWYGSKSMCAAFERNWADPDYRKYFNGLRLSLSQD